MPNEVLRKPAPRRGQFRSALGGHAAWRRLAAGAGAAARFAFGLGRAALVLDWTFLAEAAEAAEAASRLGIRRWIAKRAIGRGRRLARRQEGLGRAFLACLPGCAGAWALSGAAGAPFMAAGLLGFAGMEMWDKLCGALGIASAGMWSPGNSRDRLAGRVFRNAPMCAFMALTALGVGALALRRCAMAIPAARLAAVGYAARERPDACPGGAFWRAMGMNPFALASLAWRGRSARCAKRGWSGSPEGAGCFVLWSSDRLAESALRPVGLAGALCGMGWPGSSPLDMCAPRARRAARGAPEDAGPLADWVRAALAREEALSIREAVGSGPPRAGKGSARL